MNPVTLCDDSTKGDFRARATWMDAGPHGDEIHEFAFSDSLEGFVDLGWVDGIGIPLDNVEDGYVASPSGVGRDHDVFRLGETAHHVQDRGFSNGGYGGTLGGGGGVVGVFISEDYGCVTGHEKMTAWSGD
eukprot:CAMPEP_0194367048 /NCGR_PEP_ID=MMETSP0174-20130528/15161_1 /TAXON_ID=216777 /ORGANISM="Proboscia alata, Strain PI-D3" /LENGTH=130 /DNA_ID=CAMNT_0039142613 /DNA_START=118 /DNA_END=509 /DNA_ORIENTATION=-